MHYACVPDRARVSRALTDSSTMQIALAKEGRYLYAQEVGPRWLLDFVQRLRQPKYFMNNIVDVDRENHPDPLQTLSDNIFPAFFFGPEGSQSPLHTDGTVLSLHARTSVLYCSERTISICMCTVFCTA